jgi:hypothetical protein
MNTAPFTKYDGELLEDGLERYPGPTWTMYWEIGRLIRFFFGFLGGVSCFPSCFDEMFGYITSLCLAGGHRDHGYQKIGARSFVAFRDMEEQPFRSSYLFASTS